MSDLNVKKCYCGNDKWDFIAKPYPHLECTDCCFAKEYINLNGCKGFDRDKFNDMLANLNHTSAERRRARIKQVRQNKA